MVRTCFPAAKTSTARRKTTHKFHQHARITKELALTCTYPPHDYDGEYNRSVVRIYRKRYHKSKKNNRIGTVSLEG